MERKFFSFYKRYGIYVILFVVLLFFSIFAENFLSFTNLINIVRQVSMFGIAVVAVTFVMISGGADLSIGGQIAVNGIVMGILLAKLGWPLLLVLPIAMILGALFGFLNGYLSVKLNMASIIVTLGTMLSLNGLAYVISGGYPTFGLPEGIKVFGQGYVGPIPVPVIIFVIVVAVAWFILNKTYFGRYMYALGGNPEAARLVGLNVDKVRCAVFAFAGFIVSIASIIMLSRNNSAQPSAGASYPFDCMTAAVLGGISFAGGEGTLGGAVIGVIIIGILNNGMLLMGVDANWQGVVKGIVLVAAVGVDTVQRKVKKAKVKTVQN